MKKIKIIPVFSFIVSLTLVFAMSSFENKDQSAAETPLYWYRVDATNQIPSSSAIEFGGTKRTKTYADANDMCSGSNFHCLRGFENQLTSFPTAATGIEQTLKN